MIQGGKEKGSPLKTKPNSTSNSYQSRKMDGHKKDEKRMGGGGKQMEKRNIVL